MKKQEIHVVTSFSEEGDIRDKLNRSFLRFLDSELVAFKKAETEKTYCRLSFLIAHQVLKSAFQNSRATCVINFSAQLISYIGTILKGSAILSG